MSKRILAVILSAGLIAGLMAAPADAQRRRQQPRPVPVEVDYFLANDEGACGEDNYLLKLEGDGDDTSCGSVWSGPVFAVTSAFFGDGCVGAIPEDPGSPVWTRFCPIVYKASEGVPFTLNANGEISGVIEVSSNGGGPVTLVIIVSGQTDEEVATDEEDEGEEEEGIEIGRTEIDYTTAPGERNEIEFTIDEIDGDLHRTKFETLELMLYNRGIAPLSGHYHTDSSFITMPTIEMRRRRR
jgi:hypothetical protein